MKVIKLDAIGSTNSFLKDLVKEEPQNAPVIVVAHRQSQGRGQHGAKWHSIPGEGLTFSLFRSFYEIGSGDSFVISQVVSLALRSTLIYFGLKDVSVKWPNDIMAGSKKICGILIENTLQGGSITASVVGIGLNVNDLDTQQIPGATSMKLEMGKSFSTEIVLQVLVERLMLDFDTLLSSDFSEIRKEYETHLFKKDIVQLYENDKGHRFNGIIRGVTPSGTLLLEDEENQVREYANKEVQMCR